MTGRIIRERGSSYRVARVLFLAVGLLLALSTPDLTRAEGPVKNPARPADPDAPTTRPERTANAETSTLADVNQFLTALAADGAPIRLGTLGVSEEGRDIPLVICADPMVEDGAAARASGRVVVYLQANIHGGEVEGKEAVQMLLREIAQGLHPGWLERCVLVCTPVYNCDGNEAWGPGLEQRSHQNGPERIGQRPNGVGLDLNRDCIKAESPEMRAALARIYRPWDPHVVLDLHTTNGTRHGYTLTYAPPLHPDTAPGVLEFSRDVLLPEVREKMRATYYEATNDYGNVEERDGTRAWHSFSPHGRYVTNYVGLRNRIAVLSEATSYLPLGTRITSTKNFVSAVLEVVTQRAGEIAELCREADRSTRAGDVAPLGLAFEPASRGAEDVPLEEPGQNIPAHETPGTMTTETLEIFDRFRSTSTRALPRAYWIPAGETRILGLLRRHGIVVEPCRTETSLEIETFRITAVERARRAFQGHRAVRLEGAWEESELDAPIASRGYLVPASQPLARLAFHILEPDLPDGAVAWEFHEAPLAAEGAAAIRRVR